MPTITLLPQRLIIHSREGESLFEAAFRAGAPLPSACGGKATCGLCRVKILEGAAALSPLSDAEKRHLGTVTFLTKMRLGCQARVSGDVTIELPKCRLLLDA